MDITDIIATDAIMNYQGMKYTVTLTVAEFKDGAAFGYGWDGSGTDGADIYFKLTDGTNTYSFVIETYLTGADSDVYAAAKALQIGDTITVEGFVYWYEGFQAHVTSIDVEGPAARTKKETACLSYVQKGNANYDVEFAKMNEAPTGNEISLYFSYYVLNNGTVEEYIERLQEIIEVI